MATVAVADREKSDAYFEGGYWIELWSTLIVVAICALMLRFKIAARLRDWSAARGHGPFARALTVAFGFLLALSFLTSPWALYTEYLREHDYGMSNHALGGYLREWALGAAISIPVLALAIAGIYRLVRRVRERWVWWATAASAGFLLL